MAVNVLRKMGSSEGLLALVVSVIGISITVASFCMGAGSKRDFRSSAAIPPKKMQIYLGDPQWQTHYLRDGGYGLTVQGEYFEERGFYCVADDRYGFNSDSTQKVLPSRELGSENEK